VKKKHTATNRGKRVTVVLRDGTRVTGKFLDRTDRWVEVEGYGRISQGAIQSFWVEKGRAHR